MTFIRKISTFYKRKTNFLSITEIKTFKIQKFNPLILISFLIIFSIVFFVSSNLINKTNNEQKNNLNEIAETSEFSNLTKFFVAKLNSPYEEISYIIENNDTVEKILKRFKVRDEDIKNISVKLKQKKLANIYSGRKLSLIIKKLEDGTNTVVNFVYPVNNTTSVEIRKSKDKFLVKENILQLYKKEVVVKNIIKNNLYNSAVESGIEPNIIVEFLNFGFEVDFKEILEGDWFEILYEKFEDDNNS